MQGKDYGYELPIPDSIKSRQNERVTESTVAATYQPSASTEMTTATTTTTTAPQTAPPAEPPTAEPARPMQTATIRPTLQTARRRSHAADCAACNRARNSACGRQQLRRPRHARPDSGRPAEPTTGSANRESMPPTAAGWLTMLLSGGTLSGAGLMLRRKR